MALVYALPFTPATSRLCAGHCALLLHVSHITNTYVSTAARLESLTLSAEVRLSGMCVALATTCLSTICAQLNRNLK